MILAHMSKVNNSIDDGLEPIISGNYHWIPSEVPGASLGDSLPVAKAVELHDQ